MGSKDSIEFINKELTYLTPLKVYSEESFNEFKASINSYYETYQYRPVHKIAIRHSGNYLSKTKDFLDSVNCKYEIIDLDCNACCAFYKLINSVDTKYLFFIFSDVKNLSKKDIIYPSINCLEKKEDLIQVRLSGFPLGNYYNYPTNKSHFLVKNGKLHFCETPEYEFDFIEADNGDTVWTMPLIPERLNRFFALPFWHTIMKTEIAKKFVKATMPYLKESDSTISSFIKYAHTSDTILRSTLKEDGWPSGFEFLSDFYHGWLNFSCYLYMIGRDKKDEKKFIEDHCNEIKKEVLLNDGELL